MVDTEIYAQHTDKQTQQSASASYIWSQFSLYYIAAWLLFCTSICVRARSIKNDNKIVGLVINQNIAFFDFKNHIVFVAHSF